MNILEEFWYGNIEPAEYDTSSGKEYKGLPMNIPVFTPTSIGTAIWVHVHVHAHCHTHTHIHEGDESIHDHPYDGGDPGEHIHNHD